MSDDVDLATDSALFDNAVALRNHRHVQALLGQLRKDGVAVCRDCGFAIEAGRIAALPRCVRCLECQIAYEKEARCR